MRTEGSRLSQESMEEERPISYEMSQEEKESLRCHLWIVDIAPDSAAERAGLEVGDFVSEIDGEHVTTAEESQAYFASKEGASSDLTVKRGEKIIHIIITPTFNQELDRHLLGVRLVQKLDNSEYRNEKFERDGKRVERSYRRIEGSFSGGPAVNACIEMSADPVSVSESNPQKTFVFDVREVKIVEEVMLFSDTGRKFDVLDALGHESGPVYMALEKLQFHAGWHERSSNSVVVSDLLSVDALGTLFHEMRHAKQIGNEWDSLMALYGSEKMYEPDRKWSHRAIGDFLEKFDAILQAIPVIGDGIDKECVHEIIEPLLTRVKKAGEEQSMVQAKKLGVLFTLLGKSNEDPRKRMDALDGKEDARLREESLSVQDVQELKEMLSETGISIVEEGGGQVDGAYSPLSTKELSEYSVRRDLQYSIFKSSEREILSFEFDSSTSRAKVRVGFERGRFDDLYYVDLEFDCAEEEFASAKSEMSNLNVGSAAIKEEVLALKKEVLGYEVRDGVTVLDVLAYPTRKAERDAEAGEFQTWRKLREAIGVDFSHEPSLHYSKHSYMTKLGADSATMRKTIPPKNGPIGMAV